MAKQFTFNKRILSELFAKYPNTFVALCELLNNAIQAKATEINLVIDYAPASDVAVSAIEKLTVFDNGLGVPKYEFGWRILEVGTKSKPDGKGIGRFAALQLGKRMTIETVAYDPVDKAFLKSTLPLDIIGWQGESLEKIELQDSYVVCEGKPAPYYKVTIENFYGEDEIKHDQYKRVCKQLLAANIEAAIFSAYPEFIFKRQVKFVINGKALNPDDYVVGKPAQVNNQFTTLQGDVHEVAYHFIQVKNSGKHQVSLRVANNGIQSVAHSFDYEVEVPEPNQWFVFVDSKLFDNGNDLIRNLVFELDPEAEHLRNEIKKTVDTFFKEKYASYKKFLQRLRSDNYYPYKAHRASSESRSSVFNQLAFFVEEKHRLLGDNQKIRELVYGLMDKALNSGEFEILLEQVIKLDKPLIKRFHDLLNRVDLEDVIGFSEDIVKKQQFLDFLHKLVYGDIAKSVKERSQLHKVVERHLWIFGENYNGTPKLFSDTNLANNLDALRKDCFSYTPTKEDDNLVEIQDAKAKNITDLFFYNEKIKDDQKREIMVVELKAPKVKLAEKECAQARKYAMQIEKNAVFPQGHSYKIILVSSDMAESCSAQCGQIDPQNPYLFYRAKDRKVEAWAIKWSDLISQNKTKLSYLGNAIKAKDRNVREVFEAEFADVELQKLDTVLESVNKVGKTVKKKRSGKAV